MERQDLDLEDFFGMVSPDSLTLAQIDELGKLIAKQQLLVDEITDQLTIANKKLTGLKNKMIDVLEKAGKTSYPIAGLGTVIVSTRITVTQPQTPEDRRAFFEYLKERGIFDEMVSVNYQTLNGFAKREFEAAAQEGKTEDFSIPGIGAPKTLSTLSIRKK